MSLGETAIPIPSTLICTYVYDLHVHITPECTASVRSETMDARRCPWCSARARHFDITTTLFSLVGRCALYKKQFLLGLYSSCSPNCYAITLITITISFVVHLTAITFTQLPPQFHPSVWYNLEAMHSARYISPLSRISIRLHIRDHK